MGGDLTKLDIRGAGLVLFEIEFKEEVLEIFLFWLEIPRNDPDLGILVPDLIELLRAISCAKLASGTSTILIPLGVGIYFFTILTGPEEVILPLEPDFLSPGLPGACE